MLIFYDMGKIYAPDTSILKNICMWSLNFLGSWNKLQEIGKIKKVLSLEKVKNKMFFEAEIEISNEFLRQNQKNHMFIKNS